MNFAKDTPLVIITALHLISDVGSVSHGRHLGKIRYRSVCTVGDVHTPKIGV